MKIAAINKSVRYSSVSRSVFFRARLALVLRIILSIAAFFITTASAARGEDPDLEKIAALEEKLRREPDRFSFDTHNQLRHLYSNRDERMMLYHCDEILRHSPMDGYVLAVLSGWNLEKDRRAAAASLAANRNKQPDFRFVSAACLVREGQLLVELGDPNAARQKFSEAQRLNGDGLETYKTIASAMAANIGRAPLPGPWKVPVLEIRYFPVTADGANIDAAVTSNVGGSLADMRRKCDRVTKEVVSALEEGSRFRAYKNPDAKPSLDYEIIDTLEYLEPLPRHKFKKFPDYKKILERAGIKEYVENKGVKEVWIWGYHSRELAPWESNMASPYGDCSNSDRDPDDLPILSSTYTVYHYNYERTASEATENHMHQIEAMLAHYDGDLFRLFTGTPGAWRCGNCHFPPNGKTDYDWRNKEYASTDIEDWLPEGRGEGIAVNCDRWGGDSLKWFVYWMQSLPGADNGLTYKGKRLTDWWVLVGDYDGAAAQAGGVLAR